MKKVIIAISSCKECPHWSAVEKGSFCRETKKYVDRNGIPRSCPLPDIDTITEKLSLKKKGPVRDEYLI